jgi:hypothetical protein
MARQSYTPEYQHSWALVIGIDSYQDTSLPPLETAVKGAREVAQLLQDDLGFDAGRIIRLENEQATQRAIRRAFADPLGRADRVGRDDRVLIYFAGHGLTYDTAEGLIGCIAPYDIETAYWDTAIPMDELTRLANRSHAKHVLFLLDACFSGFATVREVDSGAQRQMADYLTRPVRQVIAAGTREQAVSDLWGPGRHSLFTGFLLEGLGGAAPAPGGILRAFHLAGYLQDVVAQHSRSRQTPQYAALMGSSGGDFVFGVRDVVQLPQWLTAFAESADPSQRVMAVRELLKTAQGDDPRLADVALDHLERLCGDEDAIVRSSAAAALEQVAPAPEPPAPEDVRDEPVPVTPAPEPPAPEDVRDEPVQVAPAPASPMTKPTPTPTRPVPGAKRARRGLKPLWIVGGLAGAAVLVAVLLALSGVIGKPAAEEEPVEEEEPAAVEDVPVPDVVGMDVASARAALEDARFVVEEVAEEYEVIDQPPAVEEQDDIIDDQYPDAGTLLGTGERVTIVLWFPAYVTPTPSYEKPPLTVGDYFVYRMSWDESEKTYSVVGEDQVNGRSVWVVETTLDKTDYYQSYLETIRVDQETGVYLQFELNAVYASPETWLIDEEQVQVTERRYNTSYDLEEGIEERVSILIDTSDEEHESSRQIVGSPSIFRITRDLQIDEWYPWKFEGQWPSQVVGEDVITVPAGTFDCWAVKIVQSEDGQHYIRYFDKETGMLVRYENWVKRDDEWEIVEEEVLISFLYSAAGNR